MNACITVWLTIYFWANVQKNVYNLSLKHKWTAFCTKTKGLESKKDLTQIHYSNSFDEKIGWHKAFSCEMLSPSDKTFKIAKI